MIRKAMAGMCGVLLGVLSITSGLTAVAKESTQYRSNQTVWLHSEQSTKNDANKLCRIPKGTLITVTDTEYGWGKTSYTAGGTTYTGWTALYLYTPESGSYAAQAGTSEKSSSGSSVPAYAQSSGRKTQIYSYLTGELGFQKSAADAIMANIEAESGFSPSIEIQDTNGLQSIGLFQWNGDRCDSFKKYCNARELEYGSVDAQMRYLKYELEGTYNKQYQKMLGFADSADGAYNAAYYWASSFEVCTSKEWEKRADRAYTLYQGS